MYSNDLDDKIVLHKIITIKIPSRECIRDKLAVY